VRVRRDSCGDALGESAPHGCAQRIRIVLDEGICKARQGPLFATDQLPHMAAVAGIELVDTGFLFDHFGPVHAEAALFGDNQIRAQRGG
jgi:hypothetical protein